MKQVWILQEVLDRIQLEAECKAPLETGGLLIGYLSDDDEHVVVTDMIGPGPNAKHRKWTYRPDYRFHREEISRIYATSGGMHTYLGDWHSHPTSSSYLSLLDKRALRNIARFQDNYINRPIMLVLGHAINDDWIPGVWRISPLIHGFPLAKWEYVPLKITLFGQSSGPGEFRGHP